MKIHSLSYEDLETGWKIDNVQFGELNLLVGASGVGKTMILKAIMLLREMVKEVPSKALRWNLQFELTGSYQVEWFGRTGLDRATREVIFEEETVVYEGEQIAVRRLEGIVEHKARTMGLLNRTSSIIKLIAEGEMVAIGYMLDVMIRMLNAGVVQYFQKAHYMVVEAFKKNAREEALASENETAMALYDFMNLRRYAQFGPVSMLYLLQLHLPEIVATIKSSLREIFANIEDLVVREELSPPYKGASSVDNYLALYIKESGADSWIPYSDVSSGILKTLLLLLEIHTSPSGTVILIDEIENSLGVNCMDDLIRNLVMVDRDLQFIMTSHHPYIMNSIHHSNWKLVTRNRSEVHVQAVDELIDFGKSKQESFIQLTQLEQFHTGVTG